MEMNREDESMEVDEHMVVDMVKGLGAAFAKDQEEQPALGEGAGE